MVHRIYAEKKPPFAVEAAALLHDCKSLYGLDSLTGLRILNRYDVEGLTPEEFARCVPTVFSEPPVDDTHTELPAADIIFAAEYLPGQFDQRADSAAECIQLLTQGARPLVRSAKVYLLEGQLSPAQLDTVKKHLINPVEAREAALEPRETLAAHYPAPPDVEILDGFLAMPASGFSAFIAQYGLAMDEADLGFCQNYFAGENRCPSLTELRLIDTYWSDHCRHTTFGTLLQNITVQDTQVQAAYQNYLALREELYPGRSKPQTLMDIATIGTKALKAKGLLPNLDESDEINACSIEITADNNGTPEPWLLLFKNETHNHPTEIEPFGGAATCIGGAIRDPLANRGYVFGAMRVTGAANPLAPVSETLPGKLPQRKLVTTAAAGYASYGNQIGLATGQVTELYHPGYMAKRMEVGAVVGAVPLAAVRREEPEAGDSIILLGGRTGRDGCGGATGSSKAHEATSLESCGAEVQKGNPPVERKLQRLFKNPAATLLIRRCNDFGAGGVSVAIGELADGLCINLDAIPKKYDGLDGTELAISESQERMAVVVEAKDVEQFLALAAAENLEATPVAQVTQQKRLVMQWRGKTIVDLNREFLNSNGAQKNADVLVPPLPPLQTTPALCAAVAQPTLGAKLHSLVSGLNFCSQKGLAERFDSTIGAASVLMPFGGKHQLTPTQALVMKLPVAAETTTCAGMAFGFDPYLTEQNPYAGAYLSIVESVAKLTAAGFARGDMYLSLQEYFERLRQEPARWGKPFAALLGALQAQLDLRVAAIGGKDSMSGSFEDMDVPPTLISFAVAPGQVQNTPVNHFQLPGSQVVWLQPQYGSNLLPNPASFTLLLARIERLIHSKQALSVYAVGSGGAADALFKMGLGNRLGLRFAPEFNTARLFQPGVGSFIVELAEEGHADEAIGETTAAYQWETPAETVDLAPVQQGWESKLEPVFPTTVSTSAAAAPQPAHSIKPEQRTAPKIKVARPRALIPVFPGTNCELDTARALERAGAEAELFILRNLTPQDVAHSAQNLARRIGQSQMVILPGGFSGGDEPEGSAKLIAAFFRGGIVADAVQELLHQRDGLMLGICNGFQALIKLGLVPYGSIVPANKAMPTLTFNNIGRHQSMLVRTRVASNLSPWLMHEETGSIHTVAISHGEGRFVAAEDVLQGLADAGQIATQYVDLAGSPATSLPYNPNGSMWAIEGITSPDGRVLGKMGHTERTGPGVHINVPGNMHQKLFEGGVDYFAI